MSKVQVDTIDTRSGTSTMQIGSTNTSTINIGVSGDTVNIPSGVTIANAGTATGFAPAGISSASTSGTALEITSGNVVKVNSRAIIDAETNSYAKLSVEFGGNNELGISFNDKDGASNGRFIEFDRGGTEIGQIKRDGTNDAISYVTSSDYRLKDGVVDKTDGIEKIKLLKPRKFYWKSNPDKTLVDGFLAHEVSDIVPEAISGEKDAVNEDGSIKPQGIDQSKLVPLLTAALQEAVTKIETLEAKVAALESA